MKTTDQLFYEFLEEMMALDIPLSNFIKILNLVNEIILTTQKSDNEKTTDSRTDRLLR